MKVQFGFAVCFFILGLGLLTGCGKGGLPRGAVHGKVTLDGQPLEKGSISFVPTGDTKGPSTGGRITNGEYSIPEEGGPVVGSNRVEFHAEKKSGKKVEAGTPAPKGTMIDEIVEAIPPKYNTETELIANVEPGVNELDFDLRTK